MIKKLMILFLVVTGGVVQASAQEPYKIVGGFSSWTYGEASSQWTMTQSGTSNIWYCIVKDWTATGSSIEWKVNNNSSWIPDGNNNKVSTFTQGEKYNLLFVLNTNDKTVKLISSVSIHGSFDQWGNGSELSMGESGLDFNGTINIGSAGEEFKLLISYNGDSNDNVWIGYTNGAALDAITGAIYDSGDENHNYTFSNIANGFNNFIFKASWDPSKGHTSTASAWTISVTPGEENSAAKKLFFTNPDDWTNVYAYNYRADDDKEKDWPGYSISKVNGFYTYYYSSAKSLIIFNDGNAGEDHQYPTGSGYQVVENAYYGASGQISNVKPALGNFGYATFTSEVPLDLDHIDNATAYYVSETPSNTVKLTIATGMVQAGEGLVLYGNEHTAEVTIPVAVTGNAISGNLLVGCPNETTLNSSTDGYANIYVLVNTDQEAQFQNVGKWITDGNTVTIPAGKAYLKATTSGAPSFSIEFGDDTTGIMNTVREVTTDNQYYTLDGRRVAQPTKGLYIVNGKKVIIK